VVVVMVVAAEQGRLLAQELAVAAPQRALVGGDRFAALAHGGGSFSLWRMSAISCSVSMMIWRWLRRLSGLTSTGSAEVSSSSASGGAGRRSV
jgi:hypothetical protein